MFSDSDFTRLVEKLSFKYDGFIIFPKLLALPITSQYALLLGAMFVLSEILFQRNKYFARRNYKFYRLPFMQLIILVATLVLIYDGSGVDYAVYGQR